MLGIFARLFKAAQGGANDVLERIGDANAITIIEQQMRDAEAALGKAKFELAGLMGKSQTSAKRVAELQDKANRDHELVQRLLAKGDEALALEVANRLTTVQQELAREQSNAAMLEQSAATLRGTVEKLTRKIADMKREIDTARVTEQVQKAQSAIVSSGMGAASTLSSAGDSLKRLRERQVQRQEHFNAQEKLDEIAGGGDLDARLASAGMLDGPPTGQALLEEIKAKMLAPPEAQKSLEAPKAG